MKKGFSQKLNNLILIIFLILLQTISVYCQERTNYNLPERRNFSKGKIGLYSGKVLKIKDVTLFRDSLLYLPGNHSAAQIKSYGEVHFLELPTGRSNAMKGMIYGGIAGMGINLIALAGKTEDSNMENFERDLVGLTLGGALIGTVAGLLTGKYETWYIHKPGESSPQADKLPVSNE